MNRRSGGSSAAMDSKDTDLRKRNNYEEQHRRQRNSLSRYDEGRRRRGRDREICRRRSSPSCSSTSTDPPIDSERKAHKHSSRRRRRTSRPTSVRRRGTADRSRSGSGSDSGEGCSLHKDRDRDSHRRRRRQRAPSYDRHRKRGREFSHERSRNDNDDDGDRKRRRKRRRRHSSTDSPHRQSPAEVSVEGEEGGRGGNEKSLTKRSPSTRDDSTGHYRGGPGSVIAGRYRVIQEVGLGTFGRVVECRDLHVRAGGWYRDRRDTVAIKVVRNVRRYYDSALIEARIIQDVNRRGGRGLTHCVILHDAFSFDGHYCMVFESLGPSLYDFMKKHSYRPFPMTCIQDFTVQLLETLEFLHSFRLIHTDLKIENILLMNNFEVFYANQFVPASTRIKIIDFGGASYDADRKSLIINTRQYRAPEVILGTGWSMPSDLWSAGCILAELYLGELLFATHDDLEHLALMERIVSPFPGWMLQKSVQMDTSSPSLVRQAFNSNNRHRLDAVLPPQSASFVKNARPLESIVRSPEDAWFLNLLRRILVIDPHKRETALGALRFLSRIGKDVVRNV